MSSSRSPAWGSTINQVPSPANDARARGIAHRSTGDLDAAAEAFRRSLATSDDLPLFGCWAHAQLGSVMVATGELDRAADHVRQALATGPALGHYEARLARCELAAAGDPGAAALLADAIDRATRGGHRASLRRLASLWETGAGR